MYLLDLATTTQLMSFDRWRNFLLLYLGFFRLLKRKQRHVSYVGDKVCIVYRSASKLLANSVMTFELA